MDKRNDILNELLELSPLLAGLPKLNVFTVPDGYFEGLADGILNYTKEDQPAFPAAVDKMAGMEVPDGYFDSLAGNILNKIRQQEAGQETELSPLMLDLQKKNPFEVPVGYFDTLSEEVSARLLSQSSAEEISGLSPLLKDIQQTNVFEAPTGYFEDLSAVILKKVQPEAIKVVKMKSRTVFLRYAVAAAFTGLVVFGGFKLINSGGKEMAEKGTLTDYQKIGIGMVGDSVRIEAEYAELSDADFIKYLESSGEDVDAALAAASVDEKDLPSKEDYLLDDKTLDKFLNNLDESDLKN